MSLSEIILIAIGCVTFPLVCAIFYSVFNSKQRNEKLSLSRTLGWYALFFGSAFGLALVFFTQFGS